MGIEKLIARDHKLREDYLKDENLSSKEKINFKIRCWFDKHFGIWDIWDIVPYGCQRFYYDHIRTIFKPFHSRLRKAIPKTWCDLSVQIIEINFEIIKSFYEDEYNKGIVDWESDEYHKKFAKWLESAYKYITIERPDLERQKDAAYPEINFDEMFCEPEKDKNGNVTRRMKSCEERYGKSYEEVYSEVNRLEALIDKKDTKILTEMIKNRDYFWT